MSPMLRATFTLLGLVMLASPLSAQAGASQSFASLMEDGLRLREEGRDVEALALFAKCLELQPESGQAIGQIAFAEMALGRLVLAEAHLATALRHTDDTWVTRHRGALEDAQAQMGAQISTVEVPLEGGAVTFSESGQPGTRSTPVTLRLSPGLHELRVTAPGFDPFVTTLNIEAGQVLRHMPVMRPSIVTTTRAPIVLASQNEPSPILIEAADPDRYLIRSIRLDVSAAVFAAGAVGTGVGAFVTSPRLELSSSAVSAPRSTANQVLIGSAIGSAGMALILFIAARVVRAKHRRENLALTF